MYSAVSSLGRGIPIDYDAAVAIGTIESTEDRFSLLQGDIFSTDAIYWAIERTADS